MISEPNNQAFQQEWDSAGLFLLNDHDKKAYSIYTNTGDRDKANRFKQDWQKVSSLLEDVESQIAYASSELGERASVTEPAWYQSKQIEIIQLQKLIAEDSFHTDEMKNCLNDQVKDIIDLCKSKLIDKPM